MPSGVSGIHPISTNLPLGFMLISAGSNPIESEYDWHRTPAFTIHADLSREHLEQASPEL
jgi:hypothetical protein